MCFGGKVSASSKALPRISNRTGRPPAKRGNFRKATATTAYASSTVSTICTNVQLSEIPSTELVSETLIANSKVAAVLSDPRQADNPIDARDEPFLLLTGCS